MEEQGKRDASVVLADLAAAAPDDILLTRAAATSLQRRFDVVPAPPVEDAVPAVHRLTGRERAGYGLSGRTTAFVGRQQELALLESRLASALAGNCSA